MACDALVKYYHDKDSSYRPDLSYAINNLSLAECANHVETFIYTLDTKCALLESDAAYAIPVQTRISILIRALKADSRFDQIVQRHNLEPYSGDAGYEKLKTTTVSFARRFRSSDYSADPADKPRKEQALKLLSDLKARPMPTRNTRSRRESRNAKGERLCWNCGKPGHMKAACTEPAHSEKLNQLEVILQKI